MKEIAKKYASKDHMNSLEGTIKSLHINGTFTLTVKDVGYNQASVQ